jgi:hypothetical protein
MDHVYRVGEAVRECLAGLADWLCGCSHRRRTFPITLRTGATACVPQTGATVTYVVCLECGHRFAYGWAAMRAGKRLASGARSRRLSDNTSDRIDTSGPAHECRIDPKHEFGPQRECP